MKGLKRYGFLLLLLITAIGYGAGKGIRAVGEYQAKQLQAKQETVIKEHAGSGSERAGEAVGMAAESGAADKDVKEKKEEEENPIKEFHRVEMDYLNDALFIGDSRTSTLYEYAGWEQTDFFVKYGLTIWDVWEQTMDGKSLSDMLSAKSYGKIYIMLGINELGSGTPESFREEFARVVEKLREMQPQAVIFVQAILHVTEGKDAEGTYINNGEINARNEQLAQLADNIAVFYLNPNEALDEPGTGKLKGEYSFDGVHLQVKYISLWREFLLDHGI